MQALKYAAIATAMALVAACSTSDNAGGTTNNPNNPNPEPPGPPPITGEARDGVSYDVNLPSDVDGENIAFTVMEPMTVAEGLTAPIILHSHGYSGSRARAPDSGMLAALHGEGFGFISLDERGNGESGGTVRILDPEFEGQDWLQVLDWAEDNLPWLRYEDAADQEVDKDAAGANAVMGAIGGSYGGGYQHLVYALDTKHRLDALAPDITWNDLRYSLFSGGVFKSMWATLLAGLGSAPPNTQDQEVQEGLAEGLILNSMAEDKQALLYRNSLASHCAGENVFTAPDGLQQIDVLYSQSALDTLFNFTDAYRNYNCLNDLGGDVRIFVKSTGHGLDNGDGSNECGNVNAIDATVAWYREKLLHQPGAANIVPEICFQLGSTIGDSITPNEIPVGSDTAIAVADGAVTVGSVSPNTLADLLNLINGFVPDSPLDTLTNLPADLVNQLNGFSSGQAGQRSDVLYDGAVDGANVLAGVPLIDLTIAAGALPANDPIVFVGLGVREGAAGEVRIIHSQMTPFRGLGTFTGVELVGVFERIEATEQLVLVMQGDFAPQYLSSSSTTPGTVNVSANVYVPLLGDVPSVEAP